MPEVGDIVQLKSGGLSMTVCKVVEEQSAVNVLWQDLTGKPRRETYPIECVKKSAVVD